MDQSAPLKSHILTDQEADNITRVEELAYEIKIAEVMSATPIVMTPGMKMQEVLDQFRTARISGRQFSKGAVDWHYQHRRSDPLPDQVICRLQSSIHDPRSNHR